MLVRDFMTTEVTTLQETDSMLDARLVFLRSSFRHVPVLRGKKVVGIVTERDIKQFMPSLLAGMGPEQYNAALETTPVSRAMTKEPMTVRPDQPVFDAAMLLYSKRFGCLPVVENGNLAGIITTTDMLRLLIELMQAKGAPQGS